MARTTKPKPAPEPVAEPDVPKPASAKHTKGRVLAVNINVAGEWYGPSYGNAGAVPAVLVDRIGADCWS